MNPMSLGRGLLMAGSSVILATVIAVIALSPSPAERRLQQRDAAVRTDLQQLQQAINAWYREHQALPPDLATLATAPGWRLPLSPSDGRPPYRYTVVGGEVYQLCARFLTDTAGAAEDGQRFGQPVDGSWRHPAGEHCFTRRSGKED